MEGSSKDMEDIKERLARIEVMLNNTLETRKLELKRFEDNLLNIKKESDYKDDQLEDRISRLENQNTWLWRTIIASIIGFIADLIIKH